MVRSRWPIKRPLLGQSVVRGSSEGEEIESGGYHLIWRSKDRSETIRGEKRKGEEGGGDGRGEGKKGRGGVDKKRRF